ncbi:hypothetical protein [Flavobacterium filum]|uniref:hypothetical protein n=1 Tax=Flavobacterium filum TaxID=370974 RepID=UPI0023F43CBE|nr:hypothetical protein [Flavobacterium filum]
MGIKLKVIVKLVVIILLFTSCSGSQKFKKSDFYVNKKYFIDSYKTAFICGCINGLTNDSLNKFITSINDNGLFQDIEILSYFVAKEADSIGRYYSNKITPIEYIDAGHRKPIVSSCIKFGLSKDVDKIANERYKEMIKLYKKENK